MDTGAGEVGGALRGSRRIGDALNARTDDVVSGMISRTRESGRRARRHGRGWTRRVGRVSTVAVAGWMAGEDVEAVREVGQESWRTLSQFAAERAVPLNEVMRHCLRWRDAVADVCESATTAGDGDLRAPVDDIAVPGWGEPSSQARGSLQRSWPRRLSGSSSAARAARSERMTDSGHQDTATSSDSPIWAG